MKQKWCGNEATTKTHPGILQWFVGLFNSDRE